MKPKYWNKGKFYLSNNDKILKVIIERFPTKYLNLNKNYYHALLNSIIGQQISVSAANSVKKKFFNLKEDIKPTSVLRLNESSLKQCGLSRQKILYIYNISNFFLNNKKFIANIDLFDELIIKDKLITIKGIGNWTIDMFLLFSIGNSNIFPTGDLGFIKAISKLYKKEMPIKETYLKRLKEKWSPYSSVATWYLWRSLDPIPVSY
jgi:DNA-3-methyladenine glycosylase II